MAVRPAAIARALRARGLTVAVAESACGGLIAARLSAVPGASAWFRGGIVAYDNALKAALLGVAEATLVEHGAVSAAAALAMADGVRRICRADVGLAETGIAGPTGGTAAKPVGLFYVALAAEGVARVEERHFGGTRSRVRRLAADFAMAVLDGEVERGFQGVHVVTCFIEREGRVALLRRSGRVGTYQGRWAAVSGYVEPGATPRQQAYQEIAEEAGLSPADVELAAEGEPLAVDDATLGRIWVIHPYRFRLGAGAEVRLDWEHSELRWVDPETIPGFETVPGLYAAWRRVAPQPR